MNQRGVGDGRDREWLAVLGHELRRPLATLVHASALQAELGPDDPRHAEIGVVIRRQAEHMSQLVDELLELARAAQPEIRLRREPVSLARLVEEAVDDARTWPEARCLELIAELEPGCVVRGDEVRLAQVLGNLLSNAAKYTPDGGRVRVRLGRERDEAVLCVEDDGRGMSPEELARVFQPFHREADSGGGLGLGLAVARTLVERHGGEIEAFSAGRGRGARFTVRLPVVEGTEPERQAAAAWPAEGAPVLDLLIVEDHDDHGEMLAKLLSRRGYRVRVAHAASEALAAAREARPDVVLTDLRLDGSVDGWELAAALRRLPALESTVLVAMSGAASRAARRRSEAAGFAAHLVKPIDVGAFDRWVRDVIDAGG